MDKKYSKQTIEKLIKTLDKNLKEKIKIIAIGGTALALLNQRAYSKDIDICYLDCKSPIDFAQTVVDTAKEIGIEPRDIEMFHGFEMTLLDFPEFGERATSYKNLSLRNIEFKIMNTLDIVLSKIHRGNLRDKSDVKKLIDEKKIDMISLQSRYIDIVKYQKDLEIRREFIKKYETFIKDINKKN